MTTCTHRERLLHSHGKVSQIISKSVLIHETDNIWQDKSVGKLSKVNQIIK